MLFKRRKRPIYRAHHIGRLRIRAAAILTENFKHLDIRAEDIRPVTGAYRTNIHFDVYRWELFTQTKTGIPVVLGCWESLTQFVREASKNGCHIGSDGTEIYPGKEI